MAVIATKKATTQLQKILKVLGEFGGMIEAEELHLTSKLEVTINPEYNEGKSEVYIGTYTVCNGYDWKDEQFHLLLAKEDNKLINVEILECDGNSVFLGDYYIDENDIFQSKTGIVKKDVYGIRKRFSMFINEVVNHGTYLTEPKQITYYTETRNIIV